MKNKIIDVTLELLSLQNEKFTVDDIAKKLGISKKTIYKYFDGKNDLAQRVFEQTKILIEERQKLLFKTEIFTKIDLVEYLLNYFELFRLTNDIIIKMYALDRRQFVNNRIYLDVNWLIFEKKYLRYCQQQKKTVDDMESLKIVIEAVFKDICLEANRFQIGEKLLMVILK